MQPVLCAFGFFFKIIAIVFLTTHAFALSLNDNGQISQTSLLSVIQVKSENDIIQAIQRANKVHQSIAIMGKQHSQGGHTLTPQGIALDMLSFNKVLALNRNKKQITIQSGITWSDLQKAINPYNLAVKSMQSPNIFTVGGSISVNAHGDDFRAGAVANSIVSFHLLLANGKKILVTPRTEPLLWAAVIGGYGLLGVITDATLQLTDNNLMMSHFAKTTVENFPHYFREKILNDQDLTFFYAHLNIIPGSQFLKNMYVITYTDTHHLPIKITKLSNPEKHSFILRNLFNLSRHGAVGKKIRWDLEQRVFEKVFTDKTVTRNNAMEKPVRFASDHYNADNADWLQEYFIPIDQLPKFIETLRTVISTNHVNLLNVTIRYVPAETNYFLAYAKTNSFAVVLYFNQNLSAKNLQAAKIWTRQLINKALLLQGTYYLPYQPYATQQQFQTAYPQYTDFIKTKQKYDPQPIFINHFYLNYLKIHPSLLSSK